MNLDPNAFGSNIFLIIYFLVYLRAVLFIGGFGLRLFRLSFKEGVERRVYEFALGNLIFSYVFHYLGIFHLLYQPVILIIFLFPSLFLFKNILTTRLESGLVSGVRKILSHRWQTKELLVPAFLILVFAPLIPHLFAFPAAWDVLAYHLTLPKVFLSDHYFSYYTWLPNTLMPVGIESLFSFGEIVGEPRLANFITFSFLAALVIYMLYGLRKWLPVRVMFVAFFLFVFRDILFTAVPIAPFVDFPLSFYTFLIAMTLIKYVKAPSGKTLLLLLLFSFFTFLIKYALGFVFIFSVLVVLVVHAFNNRDQFKKVVGDLGGSRKLLSGFLLVVFLSPIIYWLGRNFVYTHNPISPFFDPYWNKLFGVVGYDRANYEGSIASMKSGALTLKMAAKMVIKFILQRSVDYPGWKEALFGLVALVFAGLGILNKERVVRYLAGLGLLFVIPIYWLAGFPSYRYSLAAAVILALVGSVVFFDLFRRPFSWLKSPLILLFIISLWIQFSSVGIYGYNNFRDNFDRVIRGAFSYKVAVKNAFGQDNLLAIQFVNYNLDKKKDKVLTVFDNRLYYFTVPAEYAVQSADGVFTNPKTKDIEEIYDNIKNRKITHVFVNNSWGRYGNLRTDLFDPFVDTYLQLVATASGTTIYKLK